ncbi:hypothetical protein SDC9_140124 [bioreactor metagenome]|uniref:Uncharacterized protein n=1 Tax=bioreactor metagenome TaxID=1076179 RepID=A0A645DV30_9ZZZZ
MRLRFRVRRNLEPAGEGVCVALINRADKDAAAAARRGQDGAGVVRIVELQVRNGFPLGGVGNDQPEGYGVARVNGVFHKAVRLQNDFRLALIAAAAARRGRGFFVDVDVNVDRIRQAVGTVRIADRKGQRVSAGRGGRGNLIRKLKVSAFTLRQRLAIPGNKLAVRCVPHLVCARRQRFYRCIGGLIERIDLDVA